MENKKFISVKGFEDLYEINIDGEIYSIRSRKIMKHTKTIHGYYVVSLSKSGKRPQFKVHRLIMSHFMPHKDEKNLVVNHINGIKSDNRISNLEWCSVSYNNEHAIRTGLNRGKNKLSDSQVLKIKKEIKELNGNTIAFISKSISPKYNVSWRTIESIVVGSRWSHLK